MARKASDEDLIAAYEATGSIYKVGDRFGMRGSSVHERLVKLGVDTSMNLFTDEEVARLEADYVFYRTHGRVSELAEELGRTVQFLSRQARKLGLTDARHEKRWAGKWKYMSDDAARLLMDEFKASPLTLGQFCKKFGYSSDGMHLALKARWPDEWEHVIESKVPASSMYRRGRQVEYGARDRLQAEGYVVLRSPASKSPIDLVAVKPGQVLFVQCKRSGALPPEEWNALYDLAVSAGAIPIMIENPYPRHWAYWRLTSRKDGSKRRQPMVAFELDEVAVAYED